VTQWSEEFPGTAPFEAVNVRDAIGDLPEETSPKPVAYRTASPSSWYQSALRQGRSSVSDHESRYLSPLNVDRTRLIPKFPGADWRNLPNDTLGGKYDVLDYRRARGKECWYLCCCRWDQSKYPKSCDGERKNNTIIPFSVAHTADRNGNWAGERDIWGSSERILAKGLYMQLARLTLHSTKLCTKFKIF
jgi:DNA (cytosine-5)-methyltransferase 1